jgi:hypothetical protein
MPHDDLRRAQRFAPADGPISKVSRVDGSYSLLSAAAMPSVPSPGLELHDPDVHFELARTELNNHVPIDQTLTTDQLRDALDPVKAKLDAQMDRRLSAMSAHIKHVDKELQELKAELRAEIKTVELKATEAHGMGRSAWFLRKELAMTHLSDLMAEKAIGKDPTLFDESRSRKANRGDNSQRGDQRPNSSGRALVWDH